jgi:hypothetical protein
MACKFARAKGALMIHVQQEIYYQRIYINRKLHDYYYMFIIEENRQLHPLLSSSNKTKE